MSRIQDCQLITLPKFIDDRGSLSFIEGCKHVPFEIKRIFYLYDVSTGKTRGAHAHKASQQFILNFGGAFEVEVDDGRNKKQFSLADPSEGLYIPSMIWTTIKAFQASSICLVLASDLYDEADYHRDYEAFLTAATTL